MSSFPALWAIVTLSHEIQHYVTFAYSEKTETWPPYIEAFVTNGSDESRRKCHSFRRPVEERGEEIAFFFLNRGPEGPAKAREGREQRERRETQCQEKREELSGGRARSPAVEHISKPRGSVRVGFPCLIHYCTVAIS